MVIGASMVESAPANRISPIRNLWEETSPSQGEVETQEPERAARAARFRLAVTSRGSAQP